MFNLRIVQANYGDCLILEYGTASARRFCLIDGGPKQNFAENLRAELSLLGTAGHRLDLLAVSHIDTDHIVGIVDLLAEIRDQRTNNQEELVAIDAIWHNSFARAIDPANEITPRFNALASVSQLSASHAAPAILGVPEGNRVRQIAAQLEIAVNSGFPGDLISVENAPGPLVFGNLSLTIAGPTQANLDELHEEWLAWLDKHEPAIVSGDPRLMANADISVPNLSSVMFLADADGKTALLTGDGRSDHLLEGLEAIGVLKPKGQFHVDLLKVMHHGSDRNATKTFFRRVTADTYVVSANGHPDNPDLATLIWIVEAARDQGRAIRLICTNETPATRKLRTEYPPDEYGYDLMIMPQGQTSMVVALA